MFSDQPQQDGDKEHTITLSRTDIRAARRLLRLLLDIENASPSGTEFRPTVVRADDTSRTALVRRAREEFANRRRRVELFHGSMFGEAAWDMLLSLYILDVSGQRQTLGTLVKFSKASMTTAIRWINFLAAHGLVEREPHPTDLRTTFIRLTSEARDKLDKYYSDTVTTGV